MGILPPTRHTCTDVSLEQVANVSLSIQFTSSMGATQRCASTWAHSARSQEAMGRIKAIAIVFAKVNHPGIHLLSHYLAHWLILTTYLYGIRTAVSWCLTRHPTLLPCCRHYRSINRFLRNATGRIGKHNMYIRAYTENNQILVWLWKASGKREIRASSDDPHFLPQLPPLTHQIYSTWAQIRALYASPVSTSKKLHEQSSA